MKDLHYLKQVNFREVLVVKYRHYLIFYLQDLLQVFPDLLLLILLNLYIDLRYFNLLRYGLLFHYLQVVTLHIMNTHLYIDMLTS